MKMNIKDFVKVLAALAAVGYGQSAFAQTVDDQVFTVTVPSILSITAPANRTIDTTASQTDGNKVFSPSSPTDVWSVSCNDADGATVNLVAQSAFVNGASKRDARLDLAIASGGSWSVGTASSSTDYASGTNNATVTASSNAPGNGTLALTVTFINTTYSDLTEGDYVMTVRGTISANP